MAGDVSYELWGLTMVETVGIYPTADQAFQVGRAHFRHIPTRFAVYRATRDEHGIIILRERLDNEAAS